jgi:hypothetical protein
MPSSEAPGMVLVRLRVLYQIGRHMTEIELNKRIAEIQEWINQESPRQTSKEPRGRQYRRFQNDKHINRLFFLIQHLGYAPHIGYIDGNFSGKTLLHSGVHIKYPKSSVSQQYLKRKTSRMARQYVDFPPKGNLYRKTVEYWWALY